MKYAVNISKGINAIISVDADDADGAVQQVYTKLANKEINLDLDATNTAVQINICKEYTIPEPNYTGDNIISLGDK